MNLHDLKIFAAAARLGTVTKAAQSLGTVQSNVTMRIRMLEEELGAQLFTRSNRGIQLTAKGRDLLPYAQQIMSLLQAAKATVSGKTMEPKGKLRIGALQSTAAVRLPPLLRAYRTKFGEVDLSVETGLAFELVERVLEHRLDAAFVSGHVTRPELHLVPAFVEEAVLLIPSGFRTLSRYLRSEPVPKVLVFQRGCHYRQRLEHYLFEQGFSDFKEMVFGTFEGIIGCVSAGLGMTILPRSVVERSVLRKAVVILPLPSAHRLVEISLITRSGEAIPDAMDRLFEVVVSSRKRPASR